MVFGWDESRDAHQEVYQDGNINHEAKFSHEAIAGAAAFEGFRKFENHQRDKGETLSHPFAKELLAGFVGAEVDKFAETKGLDAWDRERAEREAKDSSRDMYDQHYIDQNGANQYDPNEYSPPQHFQY